MIKIHNFKNFFVYIIPIAVGIFNLLIILFPKDIISASKEGISLWFNNVLPSLLPFIIGTNILIGLGAVSFIGTLFEPVMAKLFNVSGCGAFAWILGMMSGYPIGAKITCDLEKSNQLTTIEAQRLISFSNNSGPLFMLGAVAIGMFGNTHSGYLIMISHYLSAITVGIIFRNYKSSKNSVHYSVVRKNTLKKALYNLKSARIKDGRTFGAVLGDSVKNAMETVVIIGGFIILFSVLTKVLEITNLLYVFKEMINPLFNIIKLDDSTSNGILIGIVEITNGCKSLSIEKITAVKIIASAGIVSWGGLSIHAQSLSFISKTKIKPGIYIFSKLLNGIIASIYCALLYPFFNIEKSIDTFSNIQKNNIVNTFVFSSLGFILSLIFIMISGILLTFLKSKYQKNIKTKV